MFENYTEISYRGDMFAHAGNPPPLSAVCVEKTSPTISNIFMTVHFKVKYHQLASAVFIFTQFGGSKL